MKLGDYYEGHYRGYFAYLAPGTGSTGTTGGGTAFDNRPAFQDVHVWRRTA